MARLHGGGLVFGGATRSVVRRRIGAGGRSYVLDRSGAGRRSPGIASTQLAQWDYGNSDIGNQAPIDPFGAPHWREMPDQDQLDGTMFDDDQETPNTQLTLSSRTEEEEASRSNAPLISNEGWRAIGADERRDR
jgi:hypothetical protein